jgi:hypothetical protein
MRFLALLQRTVFVQKNAGPVGLFFKNSPQERQFNVFSLSSLICLMASDLDEPNAIKRSIMSAFSSSHRVCLQARQ